MYIPVLHILKITVEEKKRQRDVQQVWHTPKPVGGRIKNCNKRAACNVQLARTELVRSIAIEKQTCGSLKCSISNSFEEDRVSNLLTIRIAATIVVDMF